MTRERVDRAWLDVARDAGRQDREGEIYLLRTEIERLNGVIKTGKLCDPRHCTFGNENEIERLRALLGKLRWKSIDRDNMEFRCDTTCYVMDEIRRALGAQVMTDIVERLDQLSGVYDERLTTPVLSEAKAEIVRLRNLAAIVREQGFEIERLRAALKPFAQAYRDLEAQSEPMPAYHSVCTGDLYDARRALEPKL